MSFKKEIKRYSKLNFCCFTFDKIKTKLNEEGKEKKILMGCPTTEIRDSLTVNTPYIDEDHKCIGILTGEKSNITVIDCDNVESYEKFINEYPLFKNYYTVKTNKGYHIYCRYTNKIESSLNKFKDGVDILNNGRFVIAPPTNYKLLNKTTAKYEYLSGDLLNFPEYLIKKYSEEIKPEIKIKASKVVNTNTNITPIEPVALTKEQEKLIKYFELLNNDFYDDYAKWVKVGMLCYSLNFPLAFWVNFSKQSNKYVNGECEKKWAGFSKKDYTLGTLFWMARLSNEKKYYELKINDCFNSVFETPIVETININQRYLLNKISEDQYLICDEMKQHFITLFNTDVKVLNIKSPYGTSKTQLMIKMIEEYNPERILMLSYRQTLTLDFQKNFDSLGFENYLKGDINADRVIIQLESLLKLDTDSIIKQYDLVLIDESERVLNHFMSSETFRSRERDTFEYLYHILDNSKKIICLDGGQSNRTYSFMANFGKNISIVNSAKVHDYEIALMDNLDKWKGEIISDLKQGKKLVIPGMSASELKKVYEELILIFPEKKIKLYTGLTDSKIKMDDAANVIEAWGNLDCVLYSPCFEAGVNFDKKHFDSLYALLCNGSCSQEAFYQMISRVRHFTSNIFKTYKGDMPDYDHADFWTYEEVKSGMIENREVILKPIYVKRDGYTEKIFELDPYNVNTIYNKVEELNKNQYYFLAYLKLLGKQKGYKIYNFSNPFDDEEDEEKKEMIDTKSKLTPILQAEDIDSLKFQELLNKQAKNTATEKDKLCIEKQMYKLRLGVDMIDQDILKMYYRKTHTIKNYIHLLDDDSFFEGNTHKTEEQNGRLIIIRKLIKLLGWEHINDTKTIKKEEFDENCINALSKSEAFTDSKTKILFNMSKKRIDLKGQFNAMRYINELLKNFGVKIDIEYNGKRVKENAVYKLVELNNISEIVFYLMQRGKVLLGLKNHYQEPKQKIFKKLYKGDEEKEKYIVPDMWEDE